MLRTHHLRTSVLSALLLLGISAQAGNETPNMTSLTYEVIRKGASIGTHSVSFGSETAGTILVDITARIRVKLIFITLFKLDHKAREEWHNGHLVKMNSATREGSKTKDVSLYISDGIYVIETTKGTKTGPDNLVPSSFTMPDFWISSGSRDFNLLDTLSGNLYPSRLLYQGWTSLVIDGQAHDTHYYHIINLETGDLSHEFWVDDAGHLVEANIMTHKGEQLTYRQSAT